MRKQIFQAICTRLAERVPDIQFIDLWNNNVATLSGGAVWPLPAVFVEFEQIEWRQQNNGCRRGRASASGDARRCHSRACRSEDA